MPELLLQHPWLSLLSGAFIIGLGFGFIAAATRYCNMGAVSDWVNIGDLGRMRAWFLSLMVIIAALSLLESAGSINLDQTRVDYRDPHFYWLRYTLGGILFGIGMVLAGGCTTKTLVNIGSGSIKSVLVFIIAGITAALLLGLPELRLAIDNHLNRFYIEGQSHQDLGALIHRWTSHPADVSDIRLTIGLGAALLLGLGAWRLQRGSLRRTDLWGGLGIGVVIFAGWYLTGSTFGQQLMNEAGYDFDPPAGLGTQSLTFIAPAAESLTWWQKPWGLNALTFGIAAVVGVIAGATTWYASKRQWRLVGFNSWPDLLRHATGGVLMGAGGVIAMGCTVGQGLTGAGTLALGSFTAALSMIVSAWVTLKIMLYRILYPDTGVKTLCQALLADLRIISRKKHPLRDHTPCGVRPGRCGE